MTFEQVAALADDFGPWMRERMRERRLTLRQVELKSGVHYSAISRLARSERQPTLRTAVALIRALGTEEGRPA